MLKAITCYLSLVVLAVAFYIFIVVWSFRFWGCLNLKANFFKRKSLESVKL